MYHLTEAQQRAIQEASKDAEAYRRIVSIIDSVYDDDQKQLEHILDRMPVVVYIKDILNRFTFFNRHAETVFGILTAELKGKTPDEVFPPATARHFEAINRTPIETSWLKPLEVEIELQGRVHVFLAHHFLLYDRYSEPYAVCGILTDITHWRWLSRVYQNIVEQSFQGLEIFQDGRIVFANEVFADMLGYTIDELMAMTPEQTRRITHEQDREMVWRKYSEREHGQRGGEAYEVRLVRKDHTVFWAEVRVNPIQYEGRPAVLAVIMDVTDRKNAERSALDLALEREKVRLISDFIQDSSHEFRTPLSTINTQLYMLRQIIQLDERSHRSFERIENSVKAINTLVDGLLTLSRLESGVVMQPEPITLATIFDEVKTSMDAEARRHNIQLVAYLNESADSVIFADHVNLVEALINIVRNAIQHSHKGGIVRLSGMVDAEHAMIAVVDEGVGMDETVQARIFERFYREDSAHSTQGLGLGLPIALKIVEAHGGHITVHSQPGQGTTVTLVIPTRTRPIPAV